MAKKKTKSAPKRATRPAPSSKKKTAPPTANQNEPVGHLDAESRPQIALGAPVFVRMGIGDYQLGVVMRNASTVKLAPGQMCVKLAIRNAVNMYDVAKFGPEIAVDRDDVSRVFMERDWDSIALVAPESGIACDARHARGPSHDELQRPQGKPLLQMVIVDEEDAGEIANAIIGGAVPTPSTLVDLARWTLHTNTILEQWKDKFDKLDEDRELHDANVLATQAKGPPAKGSIINLWMGKGKPPEEVKVTMVDANEIHFIGIDGNGGSRPLADEGDSWMVNAHLDEKTFDARAANWARMNPPRKMTGVPASQAETPTSRVDVAPSSGKRDLPKPGDFVDVNGIGICIVDDCKRGYLTFRAMVGGAKGRRRTSDVDWVRTAAPPTSQSGGHLVVPPAAKAEAVELPTKGTKISVRTGGTWETVTVVGVDAMSRTISFAADDGVGGTLRMSQLDAAWRYLSNAEAKRLDKTPAALAQGAEAERKDVERTGNKAARKAAGGKMSPIERAVSDAGGTVAVPRAPAKMVVTHERIGPTIEEPFIEIDVPRDGVVAVTTHAPAGGGGNDATTKTLTRQQRNAAEAKRRGVPLHVVVDEQNAAEDRQAAIEATQRAERTDAGLDNDGRPVGPPFVSMPKVGDAVLIMGVSGWVPTTVEVIRPNGAFPSVAFAVRGGLVLPLAGHGANWLYATEVPAAPAEPDDDELAIASDRELLELGKRRQPDGSIIDIPPPAMVASEERMPWEE